MKTKLLGCLAAIAISAPAMMTTPAMARGGGFGGGGMHGGGFGGGMHFGGGGFGGMRTGRQVFVGGATRFGRGGFHNRFFFARRGRFGNFAFFGVPFGYASYDDYCWRQAWTPYGWRWADVCYGY